MIYVKSEKDFIAVKAERGEKNDSKISINDSGSGS